LLGLQFLNILERVDGKQQLRDVSINLIFLKACPCILDERRRVQHVQVAVILFVLIVQGALRERSERAAPMQ
jgi:hypothetical protein